MIAIGVWLKHIILIVLVSVIADLLLPTKSMQKYVRAVLGIAIIAAMIQPLAPMYQRDWAKQVAEQAINEITRANGSTGVLGGTSANEDTSFAAYRQQLQSQTSAESDRLLADAASAALVPSERAHVTHLQIENAQNPDEMIVTVKLDTSDHAITQAIVQSLARTLHVDSRQVTVQIGGGG
ncbi:stage III sporulation protein AF [Alicyclobacillus fodiniaquatilis]|jgi:stage III sporulation protein AF|uniref:Stage III sporulation protein AF n=1 Tax=Alicyclobacillus fodiniaquatilis TaxID=1661150 RepID=A0ABW4JFF9_9BACL